MSSPVTPAPLGDLVESVTFVLRSINGADNVLFNRKETLTYDKGTNSGIQDGIYVSSGGTVLSLPILLVGVFIFNIDPTAVISVMTAGPGFTGTLTLNPYGAICIFNPIGAIAFDITLGTTIDQSQVTVAYWS